MAPTFFYGPDVLRVRVVMETSSTDASERTSVAGSLSCVHPPLNSSNCCLVVPARRQQYLSLCLIARANTGLWEGALSGGLGLWGMKVPYWGPGAKQASSQNLMICCRLHWQLLACIRLRFMLNAWLHVHVMWKKAKQCLSTWHYTVLQKKVDHQTHGGNFVKS